MQRVMLTHDEGLTFIASRMSEKGITILGISSEGIRVDLDKNQITEFKNEGFAVWPGFEGPTPHPVLN